MTAKDDKNCKDWTATYMPALSEGREDPSRSGFASRDEAEKYVERFLCTSCRHELALYLKWERKAKREGLDIKAEILKRVEALPEDIKQDQDKCIQAEIDIDREYGESYPACFCEWFIMPTDGDI